MSMFYDYLQERENAVVIEDGFGFAVYKINNDHLYLQDVYIRPEERSKGHAKNYVKLVEEIAKDNEKNILITSFCLNANNWFASKKVVQKCGFKYFAKDKQNKIIYCIKEIK